MLSGEKGGEEMGDLLAVLVVGVILIAVLGAMVVMGGARY